MDEWKSQASLIERACRLSATTTPLGGGKILLGMKKQMFKIIDAQRRRANNRTLDETWELQIMLHRSPNDVKHT
jgi:hypothetical protein